MDAKVILKLSHILIYQPEHNKEDELNQPNKDV
jgi:hypothetical protein